MDRVEQLKALIEKNPQDAFPRYGLAMEYKNQANYQNAIQIFDQLLEQHSDYTAAYFHFGMSLRALGQGQRAEEIFKRGIEVAGKKGESHARDELQAALAELLGG